MMNKTYFYIIFHKFLFFYENLKLINFSFFNEKNRIVGLNLFEEGISPKWEDPLNANGTTLTLNYEVRDRDDLSLFLNTINKYWAKLMIILMGEGFKLNNFVSIKLLIFLFDRLME
jgi:hypothetical protein